MMDNMQHHWIGQKPDPKKYWGFIYMIEHLPTGRRYIGKKAYRASNGTAKRRVMNVTLPSFREHVWKENNWRWYSGSSKDLTKFKKTTKKEEWEHTMLGQYTNSADLMYAEIQCIVMLDALTLVDEAGEYVYFNKSVPGMKFRPPTIVTQEGGSP